MGDRLNKLLAREAVTVYGLAHNYDRMHNDTKTGADLINGFIGNIDSNRVQGFRVIVEKMPNGSNKYTITKNTENLIVHASVNGAQHKIKVKVSNVDGKNPIFRSHEKAIAPGPAIIAAYEGHLTLPFNNYKIGKKEEVKFIADMGIEEVITFNRGEDIYSIEYKGNRSSVVKSITTKKETSTNIKVTKAKLAKIKKALGLSENQNNNC